MLKLGMSMPPIFLFSYFDQWLSAVDRQAWWLTLVIKTLCTNQPGPHSEINANIVYIVRTCLKQQQQWDYIRIILCYALNSWTIEIKTS